MDDDPNKGDAELAAKLDRLKSEQRAKSARQKQLHSLLDSSNASLEDKVAAFKTVMRTDQARFSSAFVKMLNETD
jgi:hypothetical protein